MEVVEQNTNVLYYDCANFFDEEAKGFRQYDMSKENRPDPIVQMGWFLYGGLSLAFVTHLVNHNEQSTLKPLENRIIKDFELSEFIVCTDVGLSSREKRLYNSMDYLAYVTTQSIKVNKAFEGMTIGT